MKERWYFLVRNVLLPDAALALDSTSRNPNVATLAMGRFECLAEICAEQFPERKADSISDEIPAKDDKSCVEGSVASEGTSKNLLREHLLNLRASLYTSKATFLSPISASLATVFRSPSEHV